MEDDDAGMAGYGTEDYGTDDADGVDPLRLRLANHHMMPRHVHNKRPLPMTKHATPILRRRIAGGP
jgi:hypothetical protein